MALSALDRLRLFLRPPGRGIYTVSSGSAYSAPILKKIYGTDVPAQVVTHWEDSLQRLRRVETVVLGVPSDVGAGFMRGANFGPFGIREAYLNLYGQYPKHTVDVGDVIVIPQLLHDEMHSPEQISASREALYPDVKEPLPVSPLSIAEAALGALWELNPKAKVVVLGGDHSVAWPAVRVLSNRFGKDFGILHLDAHTDLLPARVGVKYCFATWAYHAMGLVKPYALVQVGIRASGKTKDHWTSKFPIVQHWARDVVGREDETLASILANFSQHAFRRVYI